MEKQVEDKKEEIDNDLVRNLLSINGVTGVFLGADFISINKLENIEWDEIKHIVISLINFSLVFLFFSSSKVLLRKGSVLQIILTIKTFAVLNR